MTKYITTILVLITLLFGTNAFAQDDETAIVQASIDGIWITQKGNMVEVTVTGTSVQLTFPDYALTRNATLIGNTLVYITHYNDVSQEEIYLNVPESERGPCESFVRNSDERHKFTLTLSDTGMVLSGVKEINVMICEYDTDADGFTSNHRPVGYQWTYHSDYQWRRTDCDFTGLPPLDGDVLGKYELMDIILDRFGITAEFSLGEFNPRERIKFVYDQAFLDADTGEFVTTSERGDHAHIEPLDGRVIFDEESGEYIIELYPYAMESYISLLTGLTLLSHQVQSLENSDETFAAPTTQMELDSIEYVWSHRYALCSTYDDNFDHHIDYISRALRFRALDEE